MSSPRRLIARAVQCAESRWAIALFIAWAAIILASAWVPHGIR